MAEQDRYGSHFRGGSSNLPNKSINVGLPDLSGRLGAEQDRYAGHFSLPSPLLHAATDIGILRSVILPSVGLHTGLSIAAYVASRVTDRVEGKDWLRPVAVLSDAWWSALGTRVFYNNLTLGAAWSTISYPERVLLAGVSIWGGRLFYRVASRGIARGKDDPRYEAEKGKEGFWDGVALTKFLPQIAAQTVASLPFSLAFRDQHASALACPPLFHADLWHSIAVGVFASGMALEILADSQLAAKKESGENDLETEGVWSIVRHPNFLGEFLVQLSFPILLYSTGIMHPLAALAPIATYGFLRFIGGDAEVEKSQEERYQKENQIKYTQLKKYQQKKNSFWPKVEEIANPWTLAVLGAGLGGAVLEYSVKNYF